MKTPLVGFAAFAVLSCLSSSPLTAQTPRALVEMTNLTASEHRVAGFVLSRPGFLQIDATGAEPRGRSDDVWWGREGEQDSWPAAAWIIESTTRTVVWDLRRVRTERVAHVRRFSGPIRLPAGTYEAHFASYLTGSTLESEGAFRDFQLRVIGVGRPARARELKEPVQLFFESAFVRLAPESSGVARAGFELPKPIEVEVVALGELRRHRAFDYGLIQNAETRQVLWRMDYDNTVDAGGARLNRMARDTLKLPAGRYVATWVSDSANSPKAWSMVPAYDPSIWGLTLRVSDEATRRSIRKFAWAPVPEGQTIVSLLKIKNDELRSQGFSLRKALDVRVYAMGECTDTNQAEVSDGAWLMDLTHNRRRWEMRCNQTAPAGGATKNRLADTLLHLEPGSYSVFYKSDGSHSYAEWNSAPPAEPRYWGVSLFPASGQLTPGMVAPPERDTVGIIAELTRVRNDRKSRRFFSLEAPTQVRIYALGEATGGEMHDYGWIENGKTGAKVWTMEFPATRHAGGASKNRLVDSTMTIPAGRYVLYYQTDDSHAFGDWNADPPDDPESWGITLRKVR
jgi:hypothetical protein